MPKIGASSNNFELLREITNSVCIYYSIMLIVSGCICNPLSFLVFSRRTFRDTTISFCLRILALSDMIAILNGLLPYFLEISLAIQTRTNIVSCMVSMLVYFLALYMSSWTLVLVTSERVVSIVWPHRVHIVCTKSRLKMIILAFFVILSLLSVPCTLLLYRDVELIIDPAFNITEIKHCVAVYKVEDVLPLLIEDAIMFAFLPSSLLIIFNFIIVIGVIKSRQRVMKPPSQPRFGKAKSDVCETKSSLNQVIRDDQSFSSSSTRATRRFSKEASLTLTLVTISTTFVVCNFPVTAWGFGPQFTSDEGGSPLDYAITDLLLVLMYTNNSLNFLLYCLTGSKFRSEVKALFKDIFQICRRTMQCC